MTVIQRLLAAAVLMLPFGSATAAESSPKRSVNDSYYSLYRITPDHMIGIDRFASGNETWMLLSDYRSGVVRRLYSVSGNDFEMGPGFDTRSPVELKIHLVKDAKGTVTGIILRRADGTTESAERVNVREEAVSFNSDPRVRLAGTLFIPDTKGPHAAIILLHGSGPLDRWSFGPYPHFFTSLGLAVLVYDKRGIGASTGKENLGAGSTVAGKSPPYPSEYYPIGLTDDALAAFQFLQGRSDIDPKKIGLWGSSEGGMLATYAASKNNDVAFAIVSSGFVGALWQTTHYQIGAMLRASGHTPAQVDEAVALADLALRVARTGQDYDLYIKARQQVAASDKKWLLQQWILAFPYTSLDQMRWDWDHVLSFDSRPSLKNVKCPVLGVWGELDPYTEAAEASNNLRLGLEVSGNKDVTVKVFPNANHPLMVVAPGSNPFRPGNTMAPGVLEMLRSWILNRVEVPQHF